MPIREEQAQRGTFGLQGVGAFVLRQLLLEVLRCQLVGTAVKLGKADHLMGAACPLHKTDDMFLVGAACLKRVNPARRNGPEGPCSSRMTRLAS